MKSAGLLSLNIIIVGVEKKQNVKSILQDKVNDSYTGQWIMDRSYEA
jgi:hypothetical protein